MMPKRRQYIRAPRAPGRCQEGIALVIALIFLLLLTIIGVTAMNNATVQERMAGNARDRNVAFQVTERTLREAEQEITTGVSATQGYVYDQGDGPEEQGFECGDSGVVDASFTGPSGDAPCYYIEQSTEMALDVSDNPDLMYQVTGRGHGLSGDATVVLQSSYKLGSP